MNNIITQTNINFIKQHVYQVSQVNKLARESLEKISIWVEGEVSEFNKNPKYAFVYLKLKDDQASLSCISTFKVFNQFGESIVGQKILVFGYMTLYEKEGRFQFSIKQVEAVGEGLLQKKLDELILKLKAEGLFDTKHKKTIPAYPKKVCVVTSYDSAAWNDFKRHTVGKFPVIQLFVADVRVQGNKSVEQLLTTLPIVDNKNFDVIVVTRGGGSLEDLAAFNDEMVARTIFKMKTPTIVAIGHEFNESLAEWVADVRASTPTDAANIITSNYSKLEEKLDYFSRQLLTKSNYYFMTNFQLLDHLHFRLTQIKYSFKELPQKLFGLNQYLKVHEKSLIFEADRSLVDLYFKLNKNILTKFTYNNQKLENLERSLFLLSPQNTLKRGYAIATNFKGKVIKSIKSIEVGEHVGVRLADGNLSTKVKSKSNVKI